MSVKQNKYIKSPLNFIGGKHKIIDQLINLFPKNITRFIDLFCGGLNVGININAKKIIANDSMAEIIKIFEMLKEMDSKVVLDRIESLIIKNKLSQTSIYGYEKYQTDSRKGVAKFNKEKYIKLREKYNKSKTKNPMILYVLIIYAFNNQIRFNSKNEFNLPVNKRDFTNSMKKNLIEFSDKLKKINIEFYNHDYKFLKFKKSDFIYADPPYLISTATYNENGGWNEIKEEGLLEYLNKCDNKGIKFALSNVLENKGKKNNILIEWSKRYKVHKINRSYRNANYNISKKSKNNTNEVLITNY
tara:strand:+ start:1273 stop:2178 length:906 start_codon:yes stop_codon:yes gene_type:complete